MNKSKQILLVFDKFKDTLSARQISHIVTESLTKHLPSVTVRQVPISDGGDGFIDCMQDILLQDPNPKIRREQMQVWDPRR